MVRDGDEMTAKPWQRAGYRVLPGTDENGREDLKERLEELIHATSDDAAG